MTSKRLPFRLQLPDIRIGRYMGGQRASVVWWLRFRQTWRPQRWHHHTTRCAAFGPFYANHEGTTDD